MDPSSHLDTVDSDPAVAAVAQRHLAADRRVTFHVVDGAEFIRDAPRGAFDLIYADAWPGKFSHLDEALALLRTGGIYLIDDLLPQSNWPEGHAAKVPVLIDSLERRSDFTTVRLAWASGLMIAVRQPAYFTRPFSSGRTAATDRSRPRVPGCTHRRRRRKKA